MTTIDIRLIRPSPNPIRKTWDEDKMNELAASIKERGIIVPIKVRPVEGVEPCPRYSEIETFGGGRVAHEFNILTDGDAYDWDCDSCARLHDLVYGDPFGDRDEPEEDESGNPIPFLVPFEIVYGHRRVEAAKRAGLKELPAIIEAEDDAEVLIQALIENIQREDMEPIDKAESLSQIKELKGWSNRDLEKHGIIEQSYASRLIALLDELPEVRSIVKSGGTNVEGVDQINTISEMHVAKVRAAGLEKEERRDVLFKASAEKLNRDETRAVADAYKAAPTPEMKDAVLNTSGKLGDADRILQVAEMKVGVQGIAREREYMQRKAVEEWDRSVAEFLDMFKLFDRAITKTITAANYDKFSPEAKAFTVRKIDGLIANLQGLRKVLSHE